MVKFDVYSLTLVSILFDEDESASPLIVAATFNSCIKTFIIQTLVSFYFVYDYRSLDNFQPFYLMPTSIRIVSAILLHRKSFENL
jgi:hypothetical protein